MIIIIIISEEIYSTNTTRFLKMLSGTGQTKRLGSKAQSEDLVGGGGGGGSVVCAGLKQGKF